ncbi:MAG: prolyl aminopeptidase [Gammaproteobacteria bacterium]|nr:prolyl aminopeptidase [Gammaproteobacteria bacterium]MDH5801184.1 prolyl aminopeptidase [Gammaproteobacteria bacterium]
MPGLYPRIKPYATHHLEVDSPHVLYVEESGDPKGIPVVVVHGGPGAGTLPMQRTFFDPEAYRIILFDQRGCGQSTPHGELQGNTTVDLVKDMEKIREFLGVDRWVVFGGSWGATLSLVYAETYPDQVMALILRGVFLGREEDIRWFYQEGGASAILPDHWEEFCSIIPESEHGDLVQAYKDRLLGDNELARMGAAKAWSRWEAQASTLVPSKSTVGSLTEPHMALGLAKIGCHYFTNAAFLEPNQILANVDKIADIPGIIVQGRYDVICPMKGAHDLYKAWPNAELDIIPDAGHASTERGIADALVRATIKYSKKFRAGA